MVLFALTKHGVSEMLDLARGCKAAVWVNQGLLGELDMKKLRSEGFDLTDFARWIDPVDQSAVEQAVATIREHHPGQVLYIERV